MKTLEQLTQVFNDNFVAYFRSHVAHVNVTGRNFTSDHKLLQKVYEDLQDQIDMIAELIRTLDGFMPDSLHTIMMNSGVYPDPINGDSIELLSQVKGDLEYLKDCYVTLMDISENEGHQEIANYAQDRILAISKFLWMFKSTLE